MSEEAAAHHLLNVLEERELNVDLDKVLAAFEDENTKKEAAAWVNEYLNEETLLTREELEVYKFMQKKGLISRHNLDNAPIRPLLDHELSSAIESLEISTAAIGEQCKVLEAQASALKALQAMGKPNMKVEHARNERRRKEQQEKARLDITIEDVVTSINEQLGDAQRDVETEKSALDSFLVERLASDDKILTALPGIVSKIMVEPEVDENEKFVDQWCKAIVSFRTAEIKARVDIAYMEGLKTFSEADVPEMSDEEAREQKTALQAELETLHSEVASVAEMVVEHDLRKPIMDGIERRDRDQKEARAAWLDYVLSTLDFMAKRLDIVSNHAKDVHEFQHAFALVREEAAKRMPEPIAETPKSSRKRTISRPSLDFTPAVKFKPAKNLDLPPSVQDALRHAGVSFSQDSLEELQESLSRTLIERQEKLAQHYESATVTAHDKLAERFDKADAELRDILDAVYADTKFKTVRLTDEQLEAEMKTLEEQLEEGEQKLLVAETESLSMEDPKVKAFVEKYAR
ncbi:hypothetical protein BU24DRAFT_494881 [Aaosphaeria arxii CBS 175.79]|uniref:HAUS augmin-like complex subunit 3 N-terminal domain-containing protein n=1 Tax=Aaosphaeria arxii CBS 175.79 TaxID=1450172 RepID=A0A6A5XJ55_9PLEO|nr:uncharacterized protein BU24DRAFT_494881 [Aaosphaeria arxii CBS 175.79]KAF2012983.1 hypothetical protein BU24DRAFT_494881 [Aaosphaeria arxii CBS 175.79]